MSPKAMRSDAAILVEIRRLRQMLERRKMERVKTELTEAQREIETLRARLRSLIGEQADEQGPSG